MKRTVRVTLCAGVLCLLFYMPLLAQVKGDPVLNAPPQQTVVQKPVTALSPVLQQLYDNNVRARKAQAAGEKPVVSANALDKFLQLKGDAVVVDITVREDITATKASLQKLGAKIAGSFGRVISCIVPVNALPALAAIATIQFAKPAYRPMHQSKAATNIMQQCNTILFDKKPAPVVSQGDTAQRSNIARKKYNVNGKGVKVGILSDSYNNLGTADAGVATGRSAGRSG
jgi:hypothetical protein